MTAPDIIRTVLRSRPGQALAIHEITAIARAHGYFISDNACATRMTDELRGEVTGQIRKGVKYKEWRAIKGIPPATGPESQPGASGRPL